MTCMSISVVEGVSGGGGWKMDGELLRPSRDREGTREVLREATSKLLRAEWGEGLLVALLFPLRPLDGIDEGVLEPLL